MIEGDNLQNHAQLVIYQSILEKFEALALNKSKFSGERDRLSLDEIRKCQPKEQNHLELSRYSVCFWPGNGCLINAAATAASGEK